MNFSDIQKRALEIREKYEKYEMEQYGKCWEADDIAMGLVGDIGELSQLVMVKKGLRKAEDVDEKIAHELADCLYSLLVLASKYDIDIESSFLKTMDELDLKRH